MIKSPLSFPSFTDIPEAQNYSCTKKNLNRRKHLQIYLKPWIYLVSGAKLDGRSLGQAGRNNVVSVA